MKRLSEVLEGKEENYILPFFWQHGESEEILKNYMQKIHEADIKAVCVEARPHPDYLGPKWWQDMDLIVSEAKKFGMKVWILDDSHFPTGYAAGKIKEEFPQYKKWYLNVKYNDYAGPFGGAKILTKWFDSYRGRKNPENICLGIVAGKINLESGDIDNTTLIDITQNEINGVLHWDIPEGDWRIFYLIKTRDGGEEATKDYLNPLMKEATKVLIDTVYESHYERYKNEFGKTIAGFFSDEPRFGNAKGFYHSIGRSDMVLPWSDEVITLLDKELSEKALIQLPLLFHKANGYENKIRYSYMNAVSNLYGQNFTMQLGDWCRDKGVEYIGHVIEDNNAHSRLGYGPGHFFKALEGQDMSGIDVVLSQIVPGMDKENFSSATIGGWDGEFFHYGLAKLGASLGHLDKKKQGRTMCEIFGAYGWAEGMKLMKWITDHMLVRGVNYFVPHAFSPKEFPDWDCPPHFYAGGKDPQYKYFGILMNYINRMSHLLTGGKHIAPVALLYHAEAEWSGNYMLFQKPAKELMQNQIDFDVISIDMLLDSYIENNKLKVNNESFETLVIPYSEALPKKFLSKLIEFEKNGLRIVFINALPKTISEQEETNLSEIVSQSENTYIIDLKELVKFLKNNNIYDISCNSFEPYLRYYHYKQDNSEVFMFFNEEPYKVISTKIEMPVLAKVYLYDAFENKVTLADFQRENEKTYIDLELSPYESKIFIMTNDKIEAEELLGNKIEDIDISNNWEVSVTKHDNYAQFENKIIELEELTDISSIEGYESFAGTIRYEKEVQIDKLNTNLFIEIENAYEIAEVSINGAVTGIKICPPYKFNTGDLLKIGMNKITIDITTSLGNNQKDGMSQYLIQEPIGIVGSIKLKSF